MNKVPEKCIKNGSDIREFVIPMSIPFVHAHAVGNKLAYYHMLLYCNDVNRDKNKRLDPIERDILAHYVNYLIQKNNDFGIDNDEEEYNKFVDFLVYEKVIKTPATFETHKSKMTKKGYFIKKSRQKSLAINPDFIRMCKFHQCCIYIHL